MTLPRSSINPGTTDSQMFCYRRLTNLYNLFEKLLYKNSYTVRHTYSYKGLRCLNDIALRTWMLPGLASQLMKWFVPWDVDDLVLWHLPGLALGESLKWTHYHAISLTFLNALSLAELSSGKTRNIHRVQRKCIQHVKKSSLDKYSRILQWENLKSKLF